jgi:hypothetical protein
LGQDEVLFSFQNMYVLFLFFKLLNILGETFIIFTRHIPESLLLICVKYCFHSLVT